MKVLHWIICRILGIALLIFGLLLSPLLLAQTTFDYAGQTMVGSLSGPAGPVDITQVTGTFTIAQPLVYNQANQVLTPTSFNFDTPELKLLDSGYPARSLLLDGQQDSFVVSTKNGVITAWDIIINATTDTGTTQSIALTNTGDTYHVNEFSSFCNTPVGATAGDLCSTYNASNKMGGTFTDPSIKTVQAPEIDFKQAATGLLLLCGMVLVIKDSRRISGL